MRTTSLRARMRLSTAACLAFVATLAGAPASHADIIAAVEVPSPAGTDLDIALVNAGTGARSTLPAGINTSADELHPSLTGDGARLAFQRVAVGGTPRILVYDRASGMTRDVFTATEAALELPATPWITQDGTGVLTGRPLEDLDPSAAGIEPSLTRTTLAGFPTGPFSKAVARLPGSFGPSGRTVDPIQSASGLTAVGIRFDGSPPRGVVELTSSAGTAVLGEPSAVLAHPALGSGVVVFARAPVSGGFVGAADLVSRTSDPTRAASASDGLLPPLVDSPVDESRPAFTSDARYLGFVRHGFDNHDRLCVFDTQTQTLLNSNGVDLGLLPSSGIGGSAARNGNLALRQQAVLAKTSVTSSGTVSAQLLAPTGVGIFVQRIVGHHELLGKTVPKLRAVGGVPFGQHAAGLFRTRWDHKVDGRRLKPGRYLVTVRAVTTDGLVRELGRSFRVRVQR